MTVLRRRLRVAVAAWLLFQVASLSALVPRNCCAAHQTAARTARCHEPAESSYCPLRASTGAACPMHRKAQGHHEQAQVSEHAGHAQTHPEPATAESSQNDRCALQATCTAPMTALAVLLSTHGVMPAATGILPDRRDTPALQPRQKDLVNHLAVPDGPPPRA
jgi:hypothetical protein